MCTQRIFLRITGCKKFENRSTFAKLIIKHRTAYFLEHGGNETVDMSADNSVKILRTKLCSTFLIQKVYFGSTVGPGPDRAVTYADSYCLFMKSGLTVWTLSNNISVILDL